MPVTPTYPGVYIEELPSGVRTIVGVSTSVAAFIDYFGRGPIDHAVQVFSFGDFQREFGGLDDLSEASFGIRQFFTNGGSEAWVVRTAETDSYETAAVELHDGGGAVLTVSAGRNSRGESIPDPGDWANQLRIDVDYATTDPTSLMNLTVTEVAIRNGRRVEIQTEQYRNLSMAEGDPQYVFDVINEGSKLIQVVHDAAGNAARRPAETGTAGTALTAVPALANDDQFTINYPGGSAVATLVVTAAPTTMQEARSILQNAIRAADPNEPLLADATVEIVDHLDGTNTHLRVLAGRSGDDFEGAVLTFADTTNTPATAAGLVTGGGATENVQQYQVGDTTAAGFQAGGVEGENGDPPTATELIGDPVAETGMHALEEVDLFNILCIPRAAELGDPTNTQAVYTAAETYCERRRAFLIVDLPDDVDSVQDARDWLDQNAGLRHANAAAYFPRALMPNPLNDFRLRNVGASGTVAGLYARTDATRGVWKAPAGTEGSLRGVSQLAVKLTDPQNGQLNPLGLNSLRNFDIFGNVCWGARTLDGADAQASQWKYIPVRRLALFIEESLYRGTQWVVFEPNDEPLWSQIRLNIGAFMNNLFRQGAFQGQTPREAYLVKCDRETTTQNDIDRGVVNILVGFAPLKPAEFVIIQIQQLAGQIQT
jgi:phage tail sheath protein FI